MMDATDRINTALATLKNELVSLRSQDVKLMKQLIGINDAIQKITKKSPVIQRRNSALASHRRLQADFQSSETPLVRIQSLPNYCNAQRNTYSGSLSSIEDTDSSCDDISCGSDGEEIPESPVMRNTSLNASLNRPRSVAALQRQSMSGDTCFEDILKRNIKLWKYTKSISSESLNSVFCEEDIVAV